MEPRHGRGPVGGAGGRPASVGADFVFPLAFLAMLVLAVESGREALVAVLSGAVALVLAPGLGTGPAVLTAVVAGTAAGALVGLRAAGGGPS